MPTLEPMSRFFESRLDGYDEHMLTTIEGAPAFYSMTAAQLPLSHQTRLLDLGCGTGLELQAYFSRRDSELPDAYPQITGVDLSRGMLDALQKKLPNERLTLLQGSYFDLPLGECCFDAAVSVESLHHFTAAQKCPLYQKLCRSLKASGYFILTDYFAPNDAYETHCYQELLRLKREQGIRDSACYHYDTPLTVAHEIDALRSGGFASVTLLGQWGETCLLRADK